MVMKKNNRIAKRHSQNKSMGYLPANMDRLPFTQRISKIMALPLIGQCMVLEFETNFLPTVASGLSYATLLKNAVDKFELQFKTFSPPVTTANDYAGQDNYIANGRNDYTTSEFGAKLFNLAGNLPFTKNFLNVIGCSRYTQNNYSQAFLSLHSLSDYTVTTYYKGFQNVLSARVGHYNDEKSTSYRMQAVGTTGITVDLWKLMNLTWDGVIHTTENWVGGRNQMWYYSMTPTVFFKLMRDTIDVITYLESENTSIEIHGNVDGVKLDSYEEILTGQLDYINRLSDIVANANIQIVLNAQAKKDETQALIDAKLVEIETMKIEKRKVIASMTDLTSNYDSILAGKKAAVTNQLLSGGN